MKKNVCSSMGENYWNQKIVSVDRIKISDCYNKVAIPPYTV